MDESIRPRKPTDPPPGDEAQRIAADLAYSRFKASGSLRRAEADRALRLQIERQGAANFTTTGLWG